MASLMTSNVFVMARIIFCRWPDADSASGRSLLSPIVCMIGIRRFKRFYYTTSIRKSHSKFFPELLFRTFWRAESGSLALGRPISPPSARRQRSSCRHVTRAARRKAYERLIVRRAFASCEWKRMLRCSLLSLADISLYDRSSESRQIIFTRPAYAHTLSAAISTAGRLSQSSKYQNECVTFPVLSTFQSFLNPTRSTCPSRSVTFAPLA